MTSVEGFQLALAAVLAAGPALLVHVVVQRWATRKFALLTGDKAEAPRYSAFLNMAAFLTAVMSVAVICLAYYFTAGSLLSGSFFLNAAVFTLLLLEIKGNALRMPVMTWLALRERGHPHPLKGMLLQMVDQWLAGIVLGFVIVLLCPVRL